MALTKKYLIECEELISEWDYERNSVLKIDPTATTIGSSKNVYWICSNNSDHKWRAKVSNRTILKRGCPYCCHNPKASTTYNFLTEYPELAKEWSNENNEGIKITNITPHSNKKYFWICPTCKKEYPASPNNRTNGYNCPYCSHQKLSYENSLKAVYPELAKEWHPSKNGNLAPDGVFANSNKFAWWKCTNGHEWKAKINNRARGKGCKECAKGKQSSFPEQAIYYYLKQLYPNVFNSYKIDGYEADVFLEDYKIAIEYDGYRYHKTTYKQLRDIEKSNVFKKLGIILFRIRENGCADIKFNEHFIIRCEYESSYSYLNKPIEQLILMINSITSNLQNVSVNIFRDRFNILAQYRISLHEKSLAVRKPELAKEWDSEKNYPLTPDKVLAGTELKVWWICSTNSKHKWEALICSRNRGVGCPFCAGKRIDNENNLAITHPNIAKEWDYSLNDKTPNDYSYGSKDIVYWLCPNGHPSYKASISDRTRKGRSRGCPYCSGQKVCVENSVGHLFPNLLQEWDYEKNKPLTPFDFTKAYSNKVWWKCPKGHSYPALVSQRRRGSHCSVCAGRYVIYETSLAFLYPDIAKEWDYEKNYPLTPDEVGKGYDKDVWWKCPNPQHPSYSAKVYNRTKKSTGCKKCYEERKKNNIQICLIK